jgi:hypothetical protein
MKREIERKTKDNLMLSHVNINFLLIGPYAFTHIHCTLKKMWRNVQFAWKENVLNKLELEKRARSWNSFGV